jgi:crotonobetainyl-CoA:carnitine CoA-transferase CaiB-like acyl-CoA transferase
MDKWGVGHAACREANPSIVYCSVKGFGESGPLAGLRAFDTVTQALCGLMYSTGKPGDPPLKAGPSVCDLMGAAVSSMAVMTAIAARAPGQARFLDTALFDMGAIALTSLWPLARDSEPASLRSLGNAHPEHAPFDDYPCARGRIMLTVTRDAQWRALATSLRMPSSLDREARLAQREAIDAALTAWLATKDMEEAANELQSLGIPAAPVLDLAQVAGSEEMRSRRMIATRHHDVYGDVPLINTPLGMGDVDDRLPWRRQPLLGEHNAEVIGSLLGHAGELAALREQGVIG